MLDEVLWTCSVGSSCGADGGRRRTEAGQVVEQRFDTEEWELVAMKYQVGTADDPKAADMVTETDTQATTVIKPGEG